MRPAPVFPVIMCGGSGVRLWPASRPWRPKQFIPLVGERSSFQETALRVAPLAQGGPLIVVAGEAHGAFVAEQLAQIGVKAVVLLEPEARDSAPAIAAACAWIERQEPSGIALIVSADHHVPDAAAFRDAATTTLAAAEVGAIVTFGMRPTQPDTAYGYIRPGEGAGPTKPVAAFVEKPDARTAQTYVDEGYLWNSGNFIAAAKTLLDELTAHAPGVAEAARAAVAAATGSNGVMTLGAAFREAPKISIDYAVMERTTRAQVLPSDFGWSDVGAWEAVWSHSKRDAQGNSLPAGGEAIDSRDVLVRAPDGIDVAVIGLENIAVIVERDAVLVCALDRSQDVKRAAAANRRSAPRRFADLATARRWYELWLRTAALPLWGTVGVDPASGAFREGLTADGRPDDPRRRGRVQARQTYVFATVAKAGFDGPWGEIGRQGFAWSVQHGRREDGLFVYATDASGVVIDPAVNVYEQAFAMLAMSALGADWEGLALRTLGALESFRHPAGGYREGSGQPFQANCHMHLFETCLAWEAVGSDGVWAARADELAQFALQRFIVDGRLNEFFDEAWRPLMGESALLEPGHHFEWAWLMERWGASRGHSGARAVARDLFATGKRGFDPARGVVFNSLDASLSPRDAAARLWPQTEYLKAALILGDGQDALLACEALAKYLDTPARGAWRDVMQANGAFVAGPAPASSFYHIVVALLELAKPA
jgi:mannose-1-phosphate guanylyltransferase/mannose-6-phosphate isomerase